MPDQQEPISYKDFAKRIKTKYPEYKDIDDLTLSKKMVEKYPDYSGIVQFEEVKKKEPSVSLGTQSPSKSEVIDIQGSLTPIQGAKNAIPEIKTTAKTTFDTGVTEGEYNQLEVDKATPFVRGILQGELANALALNQTPTPQQLSEIASINKRLQNLGVTDAQNRFDIEGFSLFKNEPTKGAEFLLETIGNSLSSLVVAGSRTVPAGVAVGGAAGTVVPGIGTMSGAGMGMIAGLSAAGLNLSTSQKILDVLNETGIDITDEKKLTDAFQDEKLMAKAREKALKYGIPIFLFDLASGGVAGKLSANAVGKPLAKKFLAGTGEVGIQSLFGGAGEGFAQLASEGKIDWKDVGVEALASIVTDVPEIAAGAISRIPRKNASSNNKTLATQVATLGKEMGVEDAKMNLDRDFKNGVIDETEYNEGLQFVEKAAEVSDKIPENIVGEQRAKSIELIAERDKLKQNNEVFEMEKQSLDEAFQIPIDEKIKENQKRIEELNTQVAKLSTETKPKGEPEQISKPIELSIDETTQTTEVPIQSEVIYKRLVEPSKPISEMNSEELYELAIQNRKALKEQDKEFFNKSEEEKEAGGYYNAIDDVEDLRDASERINFIENAENVDDLANSVKSILSKRKEGQPNEYELAILNAAKRKSVELGIEPKELIKSIASKVANEYNDASDAEFMVSNVLEKLIPKKNETPIETIGATEVTEAEPIQEKGISQKGIERAEAKKIYKKVNETDIPNDAEGIALSYLAGGGKVNEAAINEVAGRVKRARLNTGEREFKSEEAKARDYYQKEGKSLDDIAHELWEASNQEVSEQDIKNALMDAIANNNTRLDAAKQYLEKYNPEYAEEKYYNQIYEQKKAEVESEEAEINKWLEEEGEREFELAADEEYINQLIKKYETDLETEIEQPTAESQRTSSEKVGSEESGTESKSKPTTTDTTVEPPKPPKTPKETAPIGEEQGDPTGGITLAASAERRKGIGLDDYEKEEESFAEWEAAANKKISEGFDVEKMLDDLLESGRAATPIENAVRKIYAANLDAEIAKNPTNELLAKAKKLSEVGDLLNSRAGKQLVSLKGEAAPRENITDFYVAKMEANGVDELTDAQKAEVKRQYEKVKKASEEAELRIQELEKLNRELQAQNEILKLKREKKASTTKKTKEQYAAERTKIIDDIKDKLKKARTGESGLTAIPVPYAKELIAIAPDVAKLLKIYVEEGIDNLQAVSKKIYEDVKDGFPELTQKDIVDIIAGKYKKEKPQKTELDQKLKDIQTEAKLIAKIEEAMRLEPDSEKSLVDKNRTVKELQDELRQLRKETGYYDESKLKSIISRNNADSERLKERIANKDFEEKPKVSFLENPELKKKYPKLYEEYLNSIVEKRDAKHEFEVALAKDAAAKMNKTQKAFKFGKEALNTVKAIKSGVDDSFVFVQGGLAVLANPKAGAKSFINQWKNFFNEARFKREIVRIHENKPLWNVIEKTGLDILDPQGLQDKLREEQLGGTNLLEKEIKIPGTNKKFIPAKYTTAPFERLYTSMGNSLRLEIFLKKMEQEGWTLEKNEQQLKDLARVVNEMTGRGKLHKKLEPASDAISAVIWSPKLLASTVNLMGVGDVGNFVLGGQKGYYRSLSPELRKFAIKQTAAGIGMGILIMAAYSLDPDKEVDYDPQSVTFGQIKDKKTGVSYNIFGRFTSVARYITMMATGKRTVDEKGQKISTARETWKFFRGKFNPVAGVASDAIITKKTFDGRPYELSELPKDLLMPISIGDIKKSMDEEGTLGLLTRGIPSFLGIKVMNEKDFTGVDKDLSTLIKRNAISSELDLDKYKNYKKGEAPPTKEEKKEFINKRDNYIEQRLRTLWEGKDEMNVVIDEKGNIVTIPFSKMTKEQAVDATTKIKSDATRKFKEEIFGEKELTRKEEKAQDKLEIARDRVKRKNNFD